MEQIGYSLVDANGAEVAHWGDSLGQMIKPDCIVLPNGDFVHGVDGPCTLQQWQFVRRMGRYGTPSGVTFDGANVVVTFAVTPQLVVSERERRLAAGFDYNFNDARGVHRIATSEEDMKGWSEVTMGSQAAMALGMTTAPINIVTNTGAVTVTVQEWQQILLAATQFRQPIWTASFVLQNQSPIPSDYADDKWWPA